MNMPQRILLILYQTLVLSVVDYGFGLLTLSKTQLERLEVIQNQGMRTILGCTRDTSCEAMRHLLGLLSMQERHKKGVTYFMKISGGISSETVHILLYIERFRHILGRISAS